ncbi:MAG: type II toxin-antitoxin system RelE/ParE family toxin [Candidatus Sedimenticola sp. (ex Thyasira tokunagai)]
MKLRFTHSAQRDLVRLRDFIANKNPQAAKRISQRLKQSILRLTDQPEIGVNVEELPGVQDLVSGDYLVRYAVLENEIYILRIWHGKEDR